MSSWAIAHSFVPKGRGSIKNYLVSATSRGFTNREIQAYIREQVPRSRGGGVGIRPSTIARYRDASRFIRASGQHLRSLRSDQRANVGRMNKGGPNQRANFNYKVRVSRTVTPEGRIVEDFRTITSDINLTKQELIDRTSELINRNEENRYLGIKKEDLVINEATRHPDYVF